MSAKRQNTNVEFISKVLCVYFGSSLIIHHSISLQYSGRNMQPLFQPTTNFKVSQFELILYSKCGVCFSLVGFFFRLGREKKRSSDGCWSLRWKTLRNGALDNKSVQPLLPNCRSTEVSNSNQKHSLFSVQGGTVVWFGRKFSLGLACARPRLAWESKQVASPQSQIHTLSCTATFDPRSVSPHCLISCSCQLWSKPSHPASQTRAFLLTKLFKASWLWYI